MSNTKKYKCNICPINENISIHSQHNVNANTAYNKPTFMLTKQKRCMDNIIYASRINSKSLKYVNVNTEEKRNSYIIAKKNQIRNKF